MKVLQSHHQRLLRLLNRSTSVMHFHSQGLKPVVEPMEVYTKERAETGKSCTSERYCSVKLRA